MPEENYVYVTIIQVSTALVSLLSSSIMASSIAWCGSEGSTPYRRIILGLSIADIFQSLAFLAGPLSVPASKISEEAANEVASCQVNGFILQGGGTAVAMYTVLLCVYYLYKLKYRMSDDAFKYKIERKGHAFILACSLLSASLPLAMDLYHTNSLPRSFCTISKVPTGCAYDRDTECDAAHEKHIIMTMYVLIAGMIGACFLGIIVTMGVLYHHVFVLNRNIEKELSVPSTLTLRSNPPRADSEEEALPDSNDEETEENEQQQQKQKQTPQDRVQEISRLYKREMTIQATLYVAAFCLMYIPILFSFLLKETSEEAEATTMLFFPLGGFLNILVYTRPKVANLRRTYPECSRLRGFWLVLKAGGEIPDEVDLTLSCCQDCCRPPAWLLESEYDEYTSNGTLHQPKNARSFGLHLTRIGF